MFSQYKLAYIIFFLVVFSTTLFMQLKEQQQTPNLEKNINTFLKTNNTNSSYVHSKNNDINVYSKENLEDDDFENNNISVKTVSNLHVKQVSSNKSSFSSKTSNIKPAGEITGYSFQNSNSTNSDAANNFINRGPNEIENSNSENFLPGNDSDNNDFSDSNETIAGNSVSDSLEEDDFEAPEFQCPEVLPEIWNNDYNLSFLRSKGCNF